MKLLAATRFVLLLFATSAALDVHASRALAGPAGPLFPLHNPEHVRRWEAQHDVREITATTEGMRVVLAGSDPYIVSPAVDFTPGQKLLLTARVRSDEGGSCQVFYFEQTATEDRSVKFDLARGEWTEVCIPVPPLNARNRIRIDPPGRRGSFVVSELAFAPRLEIAAPAWPRPVAPQLDPSAPAIVSGSLALRHAPDKWGAFVVEVEGRPVACGYQRPLIGYVAQDQVRWLDTAQSATTRVVREGERLLAAATLHDPDGATWTLQQEFQAAASGAIDIEVRVTVDADRDVVFLPMLIVLPGLGTFGDMKTQGLLAGVEYLDNEPSSSTADMNQPGALRRVPDSLKITFPLMAIQAQERFVALAWEPDRNLAALFDSPDRTFSSGAHVMGLIAPGAERRYREDGHVLPQAAWRLAAGKPFTARAAVLGGFGTTVVPAVERFVRLRGLPPLPPHPTLEEYVALTAAGWLDTEIRRGALFRHAVSGGQFAPHPAADAAWMMDWLAALTGDADLRARLHTAATVAVGQVVPPQLLEASVAHVRYPVAPLIYGHVSENVVQSRDVGWSLARQFDPDGGIRYRAAPGREDFGRTHFSAEASGFAAAHAASLIDAALFSGDRDLIDEAVRVVRGLQRFDGGVPRGAQTWEIPLHTPDILASGYLVHALVRGYEWSGDRRLLESARYWAWTGVPFVYLRHPTDGPIGAYATIPVLGATNWTRPVWLGLPVQWCGLVYADALNLLAEHDTVGPWRQLADGIAASGMQQSYPRSHPRHGLLPDSFQLAPPARNPADINPGTLQPEALRCLGQGPAASCRVLGTSRTIVFAPGTISNVQDMPRGLSFQVASWWTGPCFIVIHTGRAEPQVSVDGTVVALATPHAFLADTGTVVVQLTGPHRIGLAW